MEKHDTILIACSNAETRSHLRFILDERYNLLETATLHQTLLLMEQNIDCIAAVLMTDDVFMKLEDPEHSHPIPQDMMQKFPVIVITEQTELEKASIFFRQGASDVIPIRYAPYAMIQRIENLTQLFLHKNHLEAVVQAQEAIIRHSNDTLVGALSSIIEYRSVETGHHIQRIRYYTKALLEEVMEHCPEYQLDNRTITMIASASALHDIGKIAVPDAVLLKSGPLNEEEWEVMRTHAITGCRILETLGSMTDKDYLRYAHNICHYHHERWDGNGYPEGLSGEDIPICAQVVGLADCFEALTSERVYKKAFTPDQAINMILKGECGAFSPKLLECFKNVSLRLADLVSRYDDGMENTDPMMDMTLPPLKTDPLDNSLERIRAKYHALVHHIGAFLIEINLDKNLFHVVYNPYPELAHLENISTLEQMIEMFFYQIVVPEELEELQHFIYENIPQFMQDQMRRATHYFHLQNKNNASAPLVEMTLLRTGLEGKRTLAILFKIIEKDQNPPPVNTRRSMSTEGSYICKNDPNFTLVQFGKDNVTIGSYSSEEIERLFQNRLSELIHPDDRDMVRREFTRQLQKGNVVRLEHRIIMKGGRVIWVANKSILVKENDGQEYIHSFLTDIHATRSAYEELEKRYEKYKFVLRKIQKALFIWDVKNNTCEVSDTWPDLFSFPAPEKDVAAQLAHHSHLHPDDIPLMLDKISSMENGSDSETLEVRIATNQGIYKWYRFRCSANRDEKGDLLQLAGSIMEVDTEKRREHALRQQADQDSLTKLLNKDAGRRQIESYLLRYPGGADCAMLIFDLDNFKQVNDKYGHLFGDAVLKQFADAIKNQFRGQDIMCRIGGDEFMVLARGLSDRQILENKCRLFIDSLIVGGQYKKLKLGCSIGIAVSPEHGTNYNDLFNHADQALYQAKAGGKNDFRFFESENDAFPVQPLRVTAVNTHIDSDDDSDMTGDNIVHQAFHRLYTAKNVEVAVNELISSLGKKMNVSRVYVFENSDDNTFCHNTFEWCNEGIAPEIHNLQNISYETDIPDYDKNFNEQGIFYCPDINTLPQATYDIVAPQGIKSMLHYAIRHDGVFRGYIGFDECVEQRLWTKYEIEMLTWFSEILSTFLQKYREQEKMRLQTEDLHTILDNQNTEIYIADPDTYRLKYFNEKVKQRFPRTKLGDTCYQRFKNKTAPCQNCPIHKIKEGNTVRTLLSDSETADPFLMEATPVTWQGEKSCLISIRQMPGENNILFI